MAAHEDEPCFLTPDDDPLMPGERKAPAEPGAEDDPSIVDQSQAPTESGQPWWWHGDFPAGGINSKQDLAPYLKSRLNGLRSRWYGPGVGLEIAAELAVQAIDNAHAYLARLGKVKLSRPSPDRLEHPSSVEGAMEDLLDAVSPGWGKGELLAKGQAENTETPAKVLTGAQLQVNRWDEMGLGIGDHDYLAISPCPGFGEIFTQARSVVLPLKGQRWRDVLTLFADSEDGRTAKRSDLIYSLGYALLPSDSTMTKKKRRDKLVEQSAGLRKLTSAMADLGRKIRKVVATEDTTTVFEVVSHTDYSAAFTIRALWRDDENRLRFGRKF